MSRRYEAMSAETKFHKKHLSPLLGGKIIEAGVDEAGYQFLVIAKEKEKTPLVVYAARDPEDNGPGFLHFATNVETVRVEVKD
jgi:hypothetical protein